MAKRSIGEANIKITVDGVQEAKTDLGDLKSEADGVGSSFRNAADDANRGIRQFRQLAGIASFAAGALAGLTAAARGLAAGLSSVQKAANEMANDLRRATDVSQAQANIEALRQTAEKEAPFIQRALLRASGELDRTGGVLSEIENAAGKVLNLFTGMADESGKAFRAQAQALQSLAETRRREIIAAQDLAEQERLRLELLNLQTSQLDEIEQIEARAAQRALQRNDEIREAQRQGFDEQVDFLNRIQEQEDQIAAARIRQIRERQAAERQAQQQREEAEEQRRLAEELRRTQQALNENRRAIETQARAINDLQRNMQQLSRDVNNFAGDISRIGDGIRR
jgi:chromosome segregation ATPase